MRQAHHRILTWLVMLLLIGIVLVLPAQPTVAQDLPPTEAKATEIPCNTEGPNSGTAGEVEPSTIISLVDRGWQTNSQTSDCARGWGRDQWYLTLTQARRLQIAVTDCCCPGDFYEVYVDGAVIGTTSRPAAWGCNTRGSLSAGTFQLVLTAGRHLISVRNAGFDGRTAQEIGYARMCPAGFNIVGTLSAPPAAPDLTIQPDSIQFVEDTSPFRPENQIVRASVKNTGAINAENVTVRFFNGDPDHGGVQIGVDQSLGQLAVGAQTTASVLWNLTGNVDSAHIYARAYLGGQTEISTANNSASKTVSIYYAPFQLDSDAFQFQNWGLEMADILNDFKAFVDVSHPENLTTAWTLGVLFPVISAFIENGGHCYGMSATSINYRKYPEIKPIAQKAYDYSRDQARTDIQTYHRFQYVHIIDSAMLKNFGFDPVKEYENIKGALRDERDPIMLLMYAPEGGHAVVAYKMLDFGDEKRIYLYDNNMPLSAMDEALYATLNTRTRTFSYKTPYGYTFDKFIARKARLTWGDDAQVTLKRFYDWALREVLRQKIFQVSIGSPVDVVITDQQGRRVGVVNGAPISEVPGARVRQVSDKKVFELPSHLSYSITTTGIASGTMDLALLLPAGRDVIRGVGYDAVPVAPGSVASVALSASNADWTLRVDGQGRQPSFLQDMILPSVYLPVTTQANACNTQPVYDPGFEAGVSSTWVASSKKGRVLIQSTGFPNRATPHSGRSAAWLGQVDGEVASLTQRIQLPAGASSATLTYWYWIESGETTCAADHAWVEINGGLLRLHDLCSSGRTGRWVREQVDLTPYIGTSATIRFYADTDFSIPSHFLVDDVAVTVACGD